MHERGFCVLCFALDVTFTHKLNLCDAMVELLTSNAVHSVNSVVFQCKFMVTSHINYVGANMNILKDHGHLGYQLDIQCKS